MSVAFEITRLQTGRNAIRAKLVELGLASGTANLDVLADAIEGIVNQGAVSAQVQEGNTYTIPAGYHNGSGTVSGVSGGGSYNLQSKNVTPTKKQQAVTPDSGYYGLSDVTVAAIPDNYQDVSVVTATAEDTLSGKIIVLANGAVAAGTMPNNGTVDKTLDAITLSYSIPRGFHSGSGTVKIVLETRSVTPSKLKQTVKPADGKVLGQVDVEPIPDAFQNVTGVTATAPHVLDGDVFVDASGAETNGTMPNNGAMDKSIDGLTQDAVNIPAGYTTGGTVSLTKDIENALAAI